METQFKTLPPETEADQFNEEIRENLPHIGQTEDVQYRTLYKLFGLEMQPPARVEHLLKDIWEWGREKTGSSDKMEIFSFLQSKSRRLGSNFTSAPWSKLGMYVKADRQAMQAEKVLRSFEGYE